MYVFKKTGNSIAWNTLQCEKYMYYVCSTINNATNLPVFYLFDQMSNLDSVEYTFYMINIWL